MAYFAYHGLEEIGSIRPHEMVQLFLVQTTHVSFQSYQ
jgi:hypothetical protein